MHTSHHRKPPATSRILLALTAALHAGAGSALAQQTAGGPLLIGRVTDEYTGAVIEGSAVLLVGGDGTPIRTVFSDGQGRFVLPVPAAGVYEVRAERLGYGRAATGEITIREGDTIRFAFKLAPQAIVLDSILVRGAEGARRIGPTQQLIHGRLIDDETRAPIAQGAIELRRPDGRVLRSTLTDAHGLFRIVTPGPGAYQLHGERIGYQASAQELITMPGDTIRLDFHLSARAVLHAPILVTASARPIADRRRLSGMEPLFSRMSRMRTHGSIMLRDTIARYDEQGFSTAWMLTHFTSGLVQTRNSLGTSILTVQGCGGPPQMYINGAFMPSGMFSVADAYPPSTLEAVEVYRSPEIPAELNRGRWPCAVIVLWTRR